MTTFWAILSMVIIGAFVGSSTNALAIKMLFRPHTAKFIGNWQIPFTPGIIPKRKEELAKQLGNLVMNHLLTSDGIKEKIVNTQFQLQLQITVEQQLQKVFSSTKTVEQLLMENNIPINEANMKQRLNQLLEKKYEETLTVLRPQTVGELLPTHYIQKWENKIPLLADGIITKGSDYFEGPEGRELIRGFYHKFLEEKQSSLNKMIHMFLSNIDISGMLQPEIIKFIKSETTKETIEQVIRKEYEAILTVTIATVEDKLHRENILSSINKFAEEAIPMNKYFHTPINELLMNKKDKWSNELSLLSLDLITKLVMNHLDDLLEKMELAKIVQEQVESFPTQKLEVIILEIAGKELKMITILGGVLGGLIGLVQGFLSVMLF